MAAAAADGGGAASWPALSMPAPSEPALAAPPVTSAMPAAAAAPEPADPFLSHFRDALRDATQAAVATVSRQLKVQLTGWLGIVGARCAQTPPEERARYVMEAFAARLASSAAGDESEPAAGNFEGMLKVVIARAGAHVARSLHSSMDDLAQSVFEGFITSVSELLQPRPAAAVRAGAWPPLHSSSAAAVAVAATPASTSASAPQDLGARTLQPIMMLLPPLPGDALSSSTASSALTACELTGHTSALVPSSSPRSAAANVLRPIATVSVAHSLNGASWRASEDAAAAAAAVAAAASAPFLPVTRVETGEAERASGCKRRRGDDHVDDGLHGRGGSARRRGAEQQWAGSAGCRRRPFTSPLGD